jgi:uncharacterized protein (TIGR02217 family)
MPFINSNLPLDISNNSTFEVSFNTNIVNFVNGMELRNQLLKSPKLKYKVNYNNLSKKDAQKIMSFFYECQGMMNSFRIRNWLDSELNKEFIYLENGQEIKQIQIIKKYNQNNSQYIRKITKPVLNSLALFVNELELSNNSYNINEQNGLISLNQSLKNNDKLSISCIYDDEVRFANDNIIFNVDDSGLFAINNIELIEVL